MRTGWRGTATRVCLVLCVLCLGAGEGVPPASAYRFLTSGGKKIGPFFPHGEEQKPRWNAAIWGLGTTMTVAVPDDPLWEKLDVIHGMEDARRLVSEAMAQWSAVGTADIRWVLAEPSGAGAAAVSVHVYDDPGAAAGWAGVRDKLEHWGDRGYLDIQSCDVHINVTGSDQEFKRVRAVVAHELGHCLGLDHHAGPPNGSISYVNRPDEIPRWGRPGVMIGIGGDIVGEYELISYTEGIGASLLRPAPGWLETTGAVYGTVLAADYGAERTMTKVLVARLEGNGRPRNAVIRITNEWGQFVIEGLDPGNYVVMAFSHRWGRPRESWVAIRQTVRLEPVQIRAGERTGPVVLTARRPVETE